MHALSVSTFAHHGTQLKFPVLSIPCTDHTVTTRPDTEMTTAFIPAPEPAVSAWKIIKNLSDHSGQTSYHRVPFQVVYTFTSAPLFVMSVSASFIDRTCALKTAEAQGFPPVT